MTTLQFIAAMVGSLAWPAVLLTVFLTFRKRFADLIPLIEHLQFRDLQVNLRKRVEEVAADAQAALPAGSTAPASTDDLIELAERSPRAAVLEAWLRVEEAAARCAERLGIGGPRPGRSPLRLAQELGKTGRLNPLQVSLFYDLRSLRNDAVHSADFTLTSSTAAEYATAAVRLAAFLDAVSAK